MAEKDNLQDLMKAANQKLASQKKEQERGSQPVEANDIYAEMRREAEQDDVGIGTFDAPNIAYRPTGLDGQQVDINVEHEPQSEEDIGIYSDIEPLFVGGPPVGQIELWKKQFSKEKIFHTQIIDKHFIFRTLNRFEYKQIVGINNIDALYREEIICSTCVLWPLNYDFRMMAEEDGGYPSTLAQIIMENSGFTKEYGIEVL